MPRPWPRSNGAGERPSRIPLVGGVIPGRPRPPGLRPSEGGGETCSAPSPGIAVAPGRGRPPALPFPRSNGAGETPNEGGAVAPGATRPCLPRGPGEVAVPPAGAPAGALPAPGAGLPPSRAAARVGGGTSFGFSVLSFCSSSALLGTFFQPCSIFGCATLALTAGGFAVGGAAPILGGAPTSSLLPCTFVSVPDFRAADRFVGVSRWIVSR